MSLIPETTDHVSVRLADRALEWVNLARRAEMTRSAADRAAEDAAREAFFQTLRELTK